MKLKKSFRKRYHIFATHMEEATRDKVESIKYHQILRDFEDIFGEILRLPLKRNIDFSIDLVPRTNPMSKKPYKMGTPKLNELWIQLEELLKKWYIFPSVSP
jgi:hypothetical protein